MKRNVVSFRSNANLARRLWGEPSRTALRTLRDLTLGIHFQWQPVTFNSWTVSGTSRTQGSCI